MSPACSSISPTLLDRRAPLRCTATTAASYKRSEVGLAHALVDQGRGGADDRFTKPVARVVWRAIIRNVHRPPARGRESSPGR